ncbi:MAG TPA: NAD(P)/FAD-dependent oxidoreductase [Bacilli bacterium]|nr:NAD(P)/FAD-dependent oxidoreductase [Bacilli bacterium]
MMKEYDVIVVGGGIAGLTSAAYLCKYGYKTLLCEKEDRLGGLVGTFKEEGFAFDWGIRAFENSGILFPMLKNLGIEIDFVHSPVSIGIDTEWVRINSQADIDKYFQMLDKFFSDNGGEITVIAEEIYKIMGYMDVLYGIDNPLFLEGKMDKEYLMKILLPWLIKYLRDMRKVAKLNEPVNVFLGRFTDNQVLIDMITQHFFKDTPTSFALSYFGLYLDYCYPLGGTGVLVQKMTDYIVNNNGDIKTLSAITNVDHRNNTVQTANQETYKYKKLVWAANQKMLYQGITNLKSKDFLNKKEVVAASHGGDSVLTLYVGTSLPKEYFQNICGAHAFYTPKKVGLSTLKAWQEVEGGVEKRLEWVKTYLETTTYEISSPTLRDDKLSPAGKTSLIISTLFDYDLDLHFSELGETKRFKEVYEATIIDVINNSIFPGLKDKIDFLRSSTPLTIAAKTSNAEGAITGWAFTNPVMPAENRFKKIAKSIKTPIKDIYQCGQWSFSPSGLPISVLTGKLAADAIKKNLKEEKYDF